MGKMRLTVKKIFVSVNTWYITQPYLIVILNSLFVYFYITTWCCINAFPLVMFANVHLHLLPNR